MPRKFLIVNGLVAILLAAGILFVNYFGPANFVIENANKNLTNHAITYEHEARNLLTNLADLKFLKTTGDVSGDLSLSNSDLAGFSSKINTIIDLSDNKDLKIDWRSDTVFITKRNNRYSLGTDLKRVSPREFYLYFSRAKIPQVVLSFVSKFLNQWFFIDNGLIKKIIPPNESFNVGFTEEQFLAQLQRTLRESNLLVFTKRFPDGEHYQFHATPVFLAEFLGKLFGDLSDRPFSAEEIRTLSQSFNNYQISGEIWLDNVSQLPKELMLNWNNYIKTHLFFSNWNQPMKIAKPAKSQNLEEWLK